MPKSSLFGNTNGFGPLTEKEREYFKKKGGSKRRGASKQKLYKMKGCSKKNKCKGGTKKRRYHKPHLFVTYTGGKGGQRGGCDNGLCPVQGVVQGGGGRKKRGGGLLDFPKYLAGNAMSALSGSKMINPSPYPTSGQFAPRE